MEILIMTAFDTDQRRIEQQENICSDLYLDGAADAAMGESPQSQDEAYLTGYLTQLRELIVTSPDTLQIRWIPPSGFAYGWVDNPDPCCGEF
jgi:hypothetical protein